MSFLNTKESYDHLKGKVIGIDGNIGVGKTTICKLIKEHLEKLMYKVYYFEEEVSGPMLEEFIENIETATPIFQHVMLEKRQEIHKKAFEKARQENAICIIDRTLYGDLIFAKVNRKHFTDKQWSRYLRALSIDLPPPDFKVLLSASHEKCIERMMKRDRKGEDGYNEEYIKDLHNKHEELETHKRIAAIDNITAEQVLSYLA